MLYPMLMRPFYRHGILTPWGGHALHDRFGRELPDDLTGESLEISALNDTPSTVVNGPLTGRAFSDICAEYGHDITGREGGFPLLVKLIDANGLLSVQVHPGDDYAMPRHNKLGKTEAWLVVGASDGAKLYAGIKPGSPAFSEMCKDEALMQSCLQAVDVEEGDVIYIPHGLVHALGSGIMVYEIQQSSDVTYRISDWGRMGTDGKPRALHLDDAMHVVRQELRAEKAHGTVTETEGGRITSYVKDENFELTSLDIDGCMTLPGGKARLITALGGCELLWDDGALNLSAGDSVMVPYACCAISLKARGTRVIMSMLP